MSLPPIPAPPKDRYGHNVEDINGLLAVWNEFVTGLTVTLPALIWRLGWDIWTFTGH